MNSDKANTYFDWAICRECCPQKSLSLRVLTILSIEQIITARIELFYGTYLVYSIALDRAGRFALVALVATQLAYGVENSMNSVGKLQASLPSSNLRSL